MKNLLSLLILLFSLSVKGQTLLIDTLYPFAVKKTEIEKSIYSVAFSNSNIYFTSADNRITSVLSKATKKNDPLIVTYDSISFEITSAVPVEMSKLEKFISIYDSLSFNGFTFRKDKSFDKNVQLLERAVAKANSSYRQETTEDTIPIFFELFKSMSCATVTRCDRQNPCIPYDYKVNGCNARAHFMKKILNDRFNLDCKKIFAEGKLVANNTGNCGNTCIFWAWHVAVVLFARDAQGKLNEYILDPSLAERVLTRDEWANLQIFICPFGGSKGRVDAVYLRDSYVYTPNGSTDPYYLSTNNLIGKYCRSCH